MVAGRQGLPLSLGASALSEALKEVLRYVAGLWLAEEADRRQENDSGLVEAEPGSPFEGRRLHLPSILRETRWTVQVCAWVSARNLEWPAATRQQAAAGDRTGSEPQEGPAIPACVERPRRADSVWAKRQAPPIQ